MHLLNFVATHLANFVAEWAVGFWALSSVCCPVSSWAVCRELSGGSLRFLLRSRAVPLAAAIAGRSLRSACRRSVLSNTTTETISAALLAVWRVFGDLSGVVNCWGRTCGGQVLRSRLGVLGLLLLRQLRKLLLLQFSELSASLRCFLWGGTISFFTPRPSFQFRHRKRAAKNQHSTSENKHPEMIKFFIARLFWTLRSFRFHFLKPSSPASIVLHPRTTLDRLRQPGDAQTPPRSPPATWRRTNTGTTSFGPSSGRTWMWR